MQIATQTLAGHEHEAPVPQIPAGASEAPASSALASSSDAEPKVSGEPAVQVEGRSEPGGSPRCLAHARVWTPARREAVESYIAYLQEVLRLRDWTITVDWSKPTGKDAWATMTQMSDSKHATLRLSPEFTTTPPRLHGQILLHEMVHCHLFQMENLATTSVSALAGKEATTVFSRAYTSANELVTDALADAFEPLVVPFRLP